MLFIISLSFSLLTLAAGMFLLAKTNKGLGRFFKIMSWIIIGFGILLTIMSIKLAVFKCISHCNPCFQGKEDVMLFHDQKPACGPGSCRSFFDDETECGFHGKRDFNKKIMICKKFVEKDDNDGEQTEEVIKIITDTLKLTPVQEKKIKEAVDKILKENR